MIGIAVAAYSRIPAPFRRGLLRGYSRLAPPHRSLDRIVAALHRRTLTRELAARGIPVLAGSDHADTRQRLHRHLVDRHLRGPVELLEFGVFDGTSLRWWSTNLPPGSRLVGFDSFQGLPEDWNERNPRGMFDRGGIPPELDGEHIELVIGSFQETLPGFLHRWQPALPVVVHLDADLYSSTAFVLGLLNGRLPSGTILVFDEFWDIRHEHRAFLEFSERRRSGHEFLAVTNAQAAVRLL